MTDVGVFTWSYQTEDRSWLLSDPEDFYRLSCTLSVAAFTAGTHYANGYIPSGTVVGLISASSTGGARVVGPYDDTASDGRQVALGYLFSSARVLNPLGVALTNVGVAVGVAFGAIDTAQLPFNSSNASSGRGYIDTAGKTDLKNIYHI